MGVIVILPSIFACLAATNVNRQVGLGACLCCPSSSFVVRTPSPLFSRFVKPFSSRTVPSVSLPPLLISLSASSPRLFPLLSSLYFQKYWHSCQTDIRWFCIVFRLFFCNFCVCDSFRSVESGSERLVTVGSPESGDGPSRG